MKSNDNLSPVDTEVGTKLVKKEENILFSPIMTSAAIAKLLNII